MTCCLCKLHKHCIDENEVTRHEQTKIDNFYSSITGSIPIVNDGQGNLMPNEILGGGNHTDDYDRWRVRVNDSPRDTMLKKVREKDSCRPVPNAK